MRGVRHVLTLALLLSPASAWADGLVASACPSDKWQCRQAALTFERSQSLPIEWQFDTGWIPPSGNLQVHLWGGVYATTRIELAGDLVVSWPDALLLETPGRSGGGLLGYHYGVETGAQGKVHVTVLGQTYDWLGDIPYVPQIDFQVEAEKTFDSWGWDPGVTVSDSTQVQKVVQVDVTSLLGVSIPGMTGGFELDAALDLTVTYVNERIVLERPDGQPVSGGDVTDAGDTSDESYDGGAFIELDVHPEGTVTHEGTLHLIPAFYVSFLGQSWNIPIADFPIDLPPDEQTWVFDKERIHVPLPDLEIYDAVIDFGKVRIDGEVEGQYDAAAVGEAGVRMVAQSSDPDHFVPDDLIVELKAGASTTRSVRFTPSEARPYLAVLTLETNDPDAPTQMVLLRGEGISAVTAEPLAGIDADSGCGCRMTGRRDSRLGWLAMTMLTAPLWFRRRKRNQFPSS